MPATDDLIIGHNNAPDRNLAFIVSLLRLMQRQSHKLLICTLLTRRPSLPNLSELTSELDHLLRMLLKVIADDYQISAGVERPGHLLGRTDTSAYYEWQVGCPTYGTYNGLADRRLCAAAGL